MILFAQLLLVLALAVPSLVRAESFNEDPAGASADAPPAPEPMADGGTTVTPVEAAPAPSDETNNEPPVDEPVVDEPAAAPAQPAAAEAAPAEAAASAPVESVPVASAGGTYRVVKGDTLWSLAGTYLKDPYQWQKIWDANRGTIADPNLIYPDQEFAIPGLEAAAAMPTPAAEAPVPGGLNAPVQEAAAPAPAEAPVDEPLTEAPAAAAEAEDMDAAGEAPRAINPTPDVNDQAPVAAIAPKSGRAAGAGFMGGSADTFVADDSWEFDGYIMRDRDSKLMISQGDVVYLNVGAAAGVKPRMTAYVYRIGKKIRDPFLKRYSGKLVKRVGTVVITGSVGEEGCTAVVVNSVEDIRVGDIVKFIAR